MGQQQEEVEAVVISCVCVWILHALACTVCAGAMNTKLCVEISKVLSGSVLWEGPKQSGYAELEFNIQTCFLIKS